jgi:hypothetical protein
MKYYLCLALSCLMEISFAQDASRALQKKADLTNASNEWNAVKSAVNVSFASSNIRFARELPPKVSTITNWKTKVWKGEKVYTQVLIWTKQDLRNLSFSIDDLKGSNGQTIKKENISVGNIKYVITDEFRNGCGHRKAKDFDSSDVADLIDTTTLSVLQKNNTYPFWLSIKIPSTTKAGIYTSTISISATKKYTLPIQIEVLDKVLPEPNNWAYDLDLWQHPAAVARVHQLDLWSDAHFDWMKKYYTMLAKAGQKTITASIVDEPWGHQTYDDYPSLIKWTKKKDGNWAYDYSLFDKYIAFVMKCGITERINCYSMVPWKIAFTYYNENTGKNETFNKAIGTPEYNAFWATMLTDFTKHLKQKGWFEKTYIAMDERPMEAMKAVIKLLKSVDSKWKLALAGEYHPEIEQDIDNYCIASKWDFPTNVLENRKKQGKISTWYTCCTEPYPNGFSFSSPAEHVWIGWYTASKNMDGYVRWAYNSWTKNPLTDTRFTAWPAGDTYQVYPGPLSSVRFEKLIEGAQDFEKIKYLKSFYAKNKQTEKLMTLNNALATFNIKALASTTAEEQLEKVKHLLNQ